MTPRRSQTNNKPRYGKFKPVAQHLGKASKKLGAQRGFHDHELLRHWPELVGPEIASIAKPREIRRGRGSGGARLILDCLSAQASELTMRCEEIRMRLNARLGAGSIGRIELRHQHIGFAEPKPKFIAQKTVKRPLPDSLEQNILDTENQELRAALGKLGQAYYNKGT